jgi:hypothetical protein
MTKLGQAKISDITEKIAAPCADLTIVASDRRLVEVRMHFSRVRHAGPEDLVLTFDHVVAIHWHDEMFGSIFVPRPPLPRIAEASEPLFNKWTYQILEIEGSPWVEQCLQVRPQTKPPLRHYLFVAMNDLVDVLAPPPVNVAWTKVDERQNSAP